MAGLPGLNFMLADIPANHRQVARHLGVTEQTLKKYIKAEDAPRAILLALFWETRWGRSAADTEAANYGAVYYRQAMGLKRENDTLRKKMLAMEKELDRLNLDSANSPFFNVG